MNFLSSAFFTVTITCGFALSLLSQEIVPINTQVVQEDTSFIQQKKKVTVEIIIEPTLSVIFQLTHPTDNGTPQHTKITTFSLQDAVVNLESYANTFPKDHFSYCSVDIRLMLATPSDAVARYKQLSQEIENVETHDQLINALTSAAKRAFNIRTGIMAAYYKSKKST
jgi:hypothetical protein